MKKLLLTAIATALLSSVASACDRPKLFQRTTEVKTVPTVKYVPVPSTKQVQVRSLQWANPVRTAAANVAHAVAASRACGPNGCK